MALADALMRAGRARRRAEQADAGALALVDKNGDAAADRAAVYAIGHAGGPGARRRRARDEARRGARRPPIRPCRCRQFVRGRQLYEAGEYEDAVGRSPKPAVDRVREDGSALPELHLLLGESLAHLDQLHRRRSAVREELRAFPRNLQAYASLAMLYRASNRDDDVEDVLNELVAATPTPEGYASGGAPVDDPRRPLARRRAQVRCAARFRGDPSLALLGRGARR